MHASMTELLEHLKPGLIWVGADGVVRYANRSGSRRTGLAAGARVADRELARAVVGASIGQVPRQVTLALAPGGNRPGLDCRVIPGPEGDDAFVVVDDNLDEASGLDTLTRALRQDLRDPLRSARAALALARRNDAAGDALELDMLLDRVEDLLEVADRLVELATLWDVGMPPADDRIELWPLLQQVWSEVEPVALARRVRLRFRADAAPRELATLYGSERWMRRVFVECLQGAVRTARPGTEIEVEHQQDGARARIVLRDCPLFGDATRGQDAVARQLCRHVLMLHGGRLREEMDDGARHLVIELPTGAPHRADDAQLAIAQAQQYARDLSALMTHRRRSSDTAPAVAD